MNPFVFSITNLKTGKYENNLTPNFVEKKWPSEIFISTKHKKTSTNCLKSDEMGKFDNYMSRKVINMLIGL
jgi:hypothetical protein